MRPERSGPIAGVVLAAGSSARMGRNKLLLPLEGESVLRRAVRRVASAGLEPIVVVLGHEAERAREELAGLPCRPVLNADHALGLATSVRTGVAALAPESIAAVVALADMPFVTAEMLATLVERYRRGAAPLVVSDYGGVLAPPMLYDRRLFGELRAAEGNSCGKHVVKRHRDEAEVVPWPPAALSDVDVPEDYERIRAALEAR